MLGHECKSRVHSGAVSRAGALIVSGNSGAVLRRLDRRSHIGKLHAIVISE